MSEQNEISDPQPEDNIDPSEAIDLEEYEDVTPEEITDPNHSDFCEPAEGIAPLEEE